MSDENADKPDLFAICREILILLLDGKMPEDVDQLLAGNGVSSDDRPQLINITVISAQAVSPVIEQKISRGAAVKNLIEQGMESDLAESMVSMILDVMSERAENKVIASGGTAPEIPENTAKILMRLGVAIITDLQNGGDEAAMTQAIHNIEGIDEITEIYNRESEFVANVKLAADAAERAQALPLPDVIVQLGIDKLPPYVGVLTLFFMRMKRGE